MLRGNVCEENSFNHTGSFSNYLLWGFTFIAIFLVITGLKTVTVRERDNRGVRKRVRSEMNVFNQLNEWIYFSLSACLKQLEVSCKAPQTAGKLLAAHHVTTPLHMWPV